MGKRVLVVEDCVSAAEQLTRIISGTPGFAVAAVARNGAEGVRLYAALRPDIVCMDIVMPELDGLQAARAILRIAPEAIIYMISSVADVPSKLSKAIALGCMDVIPKPFAAEEVRAMLLSAT